MKVNVSIPAHDISEQDTLTIVRICIKMADSLVDYDTLNYLGKTNKNILYKREVKKSIVAWAEYVDEFSSRFLVPFMNANEEVCISLTTQFRELSDGIEFESEEITSLALVYAKCVSILTDLNTMRYTDPLIERLYVLTRRVVLNIEKYSKKLLTQEAKQGHSPKLLVKTFNLLGNKIMYRKSEEDESIQ